MITLHAGIHHTGSTSIQTALHVSKGNLDTRHIYIPWDEVFRGDAELCDDGPARLRSLAEAGWHPITSSEGALGHAGDVYASAQGMTRQLVDAFDGYDFRVIVYLRPQHKWVASAYTHFRDAGGATPAEEFVAAAMGQPNLHHTHLVRTLLEVLGEDRLIVRPHTRFQDAVGDFFAVAGLGPVPAYAQGTWANALSRDGVSPLPLPEQRALYELFADDWPELLALLRETYGTLDPAFEQAFQIGSAWPPLPWAEPYRSPLSPDVTRDRPRRLSERLAYLAQHGPREVRYRLQKHHALRGP